MSLYIHVPFCASKCEYCAFYSHPANGDMVDRYVSALLREFELVKWSGRPKTVFFGGGTPTFLNLRQWERILKAMERLDLLGAEEWTVECNPATVSDDKARLLRSFGVNRVSMGVQSLNEELLERLGRIHTREQVFRSFETLRRAGFDNINLDLMFAIPGQTMSLWRETLAEAAALGSEHLSCYEVIFEEDTPLFVQLQAGQFSVDEDLACDMYEELMSFSQNHGFEQYEVANFARRHSAAFPDPPDLACRHNVNYWRGGDCFGLGPSATEYVGGVRTKNCSNTVRYCERLESGERALEWREQLSPLARAGETAAFGLRMNSGWSFRVFEEITGYDLRSGWAAEMEGLVNRGYGRRDEVRFHLTSLGIRFADSAAETFLRPDTILADRVERTRKAELLRFASLGAR